MSKKKSVPPKRITTEYGTIIIEETTARGEPVRLYRHNGAFSSGTFLRKERKYDILFDYPKCYETAFELTDIRSVLMIGGAAYQYPKYYISHHEGSMDVVEIDPSAEKIARKWFFLDDLYEDYDLYNTHRLNCITKDAREFLTITEKKYDAVFNDAFSGALPVIKMATLEAVTDIKKHLTDEGIYMSNVLGRVFGPGSEFLKSVVATSRSVFRYVYILQCTPEGKRGDEKTNYMLLATDRNVEITDRIPYHLSRFDAILTDSSINSQEKEMKELPVYYKRNVTGS